MKALKWFLFGTGCILFGFSIKYFMESNLLTLCFSIALMLGCYLCFSWKLYSCRLASTQASENNNKDR